MNKTFSRMLYNAKKTTDKVVGAVSDNSGNILNSVETVVNENIALAKLVTSCAVLEGEISELYEKLGECVFQEGLTPENEQAMTIMNTLFEKTEALETKRAEYQAILHKEKDVEDGVSETSCDDTETSETVEDIDTSKTSGVNEVSEDKEDK